MRDAITLAAADETRSNISLLDDFLQEACSGGNNSRSAIWLLGSFEEKHVLDGYGQWLQSTSSIDGHLNSVPEDLSKLSNPIPPAEPISDWYSDSGEVSNVHSSGLTDSSLEFEMQQMASMFPDDATAGHGIASSSWEDEQRSFLMERNKVLVTQHS